MVELIFAMIVIMVVVASLPMITQSMNKGLEQNIIQEAVFAASIELQQASSGHWDANSMRDINESIFARVVNIDNDCNTTTHLRLGHIAQPLHRRCINDTSITSASNTAGNTAFKTLDDFKHGAAPLYITDTDPQSGYKNTNLTISLDVTQLPTDNNVKVLTATIRDGDTNETLTTLHTQSANIGEIDYYKRTF